MRFKSSTIQPGGRLSYGHYMADGNITSSVVKTTYYGNDTTTTIADNNEGGKKDDKTGFYMFLSKESEVFDASIIAISGCTDTIQVIGYKENSRVPTYVMALDEVEMTYDDATGEAILTPPANSGITGIPSSGMSITVSNNGTSATTINISINSDIIGDGGEITLPCNIYLSQDAEMGPEVEKWYPRQSDCERVDFIYTYKIERGSPSSSYVLELTNDSAGINCDLAGNILTGATRPQCQAQLYFGLEHITSGVNYDISTPPSAAVSGLGINHSTGQLLYDGSAAQGAVFGFLGTALEITFVATYSGYTMSKIMTITKQFPGQDGTGATTRWIVPSRNIIAYDPNQHTLDPQSITATVMKQVNDNQPEVDNATTMYYDWDTEQPQQVYNGPIAVLAGHSYLALGLRNSAGTYYELETISVLSEGTNGLPGASGQSSYCLDLSNESDYVNCDYEGNIIAGQAQYLSCVATLYYGKNAYSAATYELASNYAGVSINTNTGAITFSSGYESNFTGNTCQIRVYALVDGTRVAQAVMTLVKNLPGAPGENAVRYWLNLSANAVAVNSGGTASPSRITVSAMTQVGGEAPSGATGATIVYGFDTVLPSTSYPSTGITILPSASYLTVKLSVGGVQRDIETIPILHDGKDGQGQQGMKGSAIRGPVEWTEASQRHWVSGNGPSSAYTGTTEESYKWIDVVFRMVNGEKVYYYCNTSYSQTGSTTNWSSVSQYWTQADDEFDFVAAKLILAENSYIKFMTGNELYLTDANGNITGGAKAASTGVSSGQSIIFWAGATNDGTNIEQAPFKVDYSGNIYAKSGIFAGYIQMPYTMFRDLAPNWEVSASTVSAIYLSETDWQGRLAAAPENPVSGMTYADTNTQKYYLYTNRWVEVSKTGNVEGFFADERAYLVQSTVGADKIILPEPSASLNGFTYHILTLPNPPTRTPGTGDGVELVAMNNSEAFRMFAFAEGTMFDEYSKLEFHGGHIELTCIPMLDNYDVVYYWVCTMCTGGVDLFINGSNGFEFQGAYYPVCGYSPNDGYYAPRLIQTDGSFSSSRRRDVIYITVQ